MIITIELNDRGNYIMIFKPFVPTKYIKDLYTQKYKLFSTEVCNCMQKSLNDIEFSERIDSNNTCDTMFSRATFWQNEINKVVDEIERIKIIKNIGEQKD